MPSEKPLETVRIKIEHRVGGVYISSTDVPGLWLWGEDVEQVFKNIIPAIRVLYKYNRNLDVEVKEAPIPKMLRWLKAEWQNEKYEIYSASQQQHSVHG